ncbi:hypothetical protein Tco_1257163 [Tanacetum coccineum]
MPHHEKMYVNPSHTKKIFANMKREGKDFYGRITSLFATMMKKQSRRKQKKNTEVPLPSDSTVDVPNGEHVPTHSNDPLLSGEDRMKLTELMNMCTKLSERVLDLEHTKTAQAQEITNLKLRVKKLEKKSGFKTHNFKRLYKVGVIKRVESSDDESLGAQEDASKQGRSKIEAIDRDAEVTLVETQRRNDENDDNLMFDTGAFDGDEIVVEIEEPSGWTNIWSAPFEALYGRKCRSLVLWAEIEESSLTRLELVQEMTDKKAIVHFGKKRKLTLRYVGPFEILERIGLVAYRLRLPEELSSVHDTFHVSNLNKCLADADLRVPLDEIKVDKTLRFIEEPVKIMDLEINNLKRRNIALVKARWNSKRGPEFN